MTPNINLRALPWIAVLLWVLLTAAGFFFTKAVQQKDVPVVQFDPMPTNLVIIVSQNSTGKWIISTRVFTNAVP